MPRLLPWLLAGLSVTAALWLRVRGRGPYFPGYDVLGAAQGLYLLSTHSLGELLSWYVHGRQDPQMPWNLSGALLVLLPGALTKLWPWEGWADVVMAGGMLAAWALLVRATDLGPRGWIVLLAWGASGTLLSWSLTGHAYLSNAWPHALALWTVLRVRRPLVALCLGLLAVEVAWNVQELGRTAGLVFAAAVLFRPAPPRLRAVWAAVTLAFGAAVGIWPDFNTRVFADVVWPGLAEAVHRLGSVAVLTLDTPGFLGAATLAAGVLAWRRSWFWLAVAGAQLALVTTLALRRPDDVLARRFALCSFYGVALIAVAYRASGPTGRAALATVLLLANAEQHLDTVRFYARPLGGLGGYDWTMPYTGGGPWYMVPFLEVDFARAMRAHVEGGQTVLALYNLESYPENWANPTAVLERLYVHFGPERFARQVVAFGSRNLRGNVLPLRPLSALDATVATIDPERTVGYAYTNQRDSEELRREMQQVRAAIEKRFVLVEEEVAAGGEARLVRFRLLPRDAPDPWSRAPTAGG